MTMLTPMLYADNDLTIYHAQAIKQRWLEALQSREGDATLGLSGVGEIDTAGLQLLWLLRREAHASGRRLNIVAVSPAVADLLAFCRLTENFAAPRVTEPGVEAAWRLWMN